MVAIRKIRGCALKVFLARGRHVIKRHEPVRIAERKRLQQHTVDDAEDGCRRADPQRQREDRNAREPGLLPEDARGVAKTLHEGREHVFRCRSRCDWRRCLRLPQRRHVIRQDLLALELLQVQLRGLVRRRPTCDQLAPAVIEVLRELLDDLALAGRRQLQRRQSGADFLRPACRRVRHVRLRSPAGRPRRTPPTSSSAVPALVALQPSLCRGGGAARQAFQPTCP